MNRIKLMISFLTLIISLTFSVNSHAKIFELHQCYQTHYMQKVKYKDWKEYSEKKYYEDFIFSVDTKEEKVTKLFIISNTKKYIKKKQETWEKLKDFYVNRLKTTVEYFEKQFPYPYGATKYNKEVYKLKDLSAGIATAIEKKSDISIDYLNINLNNGEIETYMDVTASMGKASPVGIIPTANYKCKKK